MASALDSWFTLHFPHFSLRPLSHLPIYHRFLQLHYPFELQTSQRSERFTSSPATDVYEWSETDRSERFIHNKTEGEGEYGYEVSYQDKGHTVAVRSWTNADAEWGSIAKSFPQWTLTETWKLAAEQRVYERMTSENGVVKKVRCGVQGDGERWVEETWEQPGESEFKKSWEKPGQSGGETRMTREGYSWGSEWFSDGERLEKKCWNEDKVRRWGSATGKVGKDSSWEHDWDFASDVKFEQKLSHKAGTTIGYRYKQTTDEWTKEEWQGTSAPASIDISLLHLQQMYDKEYIGALESDRTLRLISAGNVDYAAKMNNLSQRITDVNNSVKNDVATLLAKIDELMDVRNEQEKLKQTMREEEEVDWKMMASYVASCKEYANDSLETLFSLAKVMKTDEFDAEVTKCKNEVKSLISNDNLSFGSQISAWKSAVSRMEFIKRDQLRYLTSTPDPQTHSETTLRQQELENCIKSAYHTFAKIYEIAWELNALAGDEDRKIVLESLKRRFEGGQIESGVGQLRSLLAALRSFSSIQRELIDNIMLGTETKSSKDEDNEIGKSLAELTKRIVEIAGVSEEEKFEIDMEMKHVKISSGGVGSLWVKRMTELIQKSIDRAEDNANNGKVALNKMKKVVSEMGKVAESLADCSPPLKKELHVLASDMTANEIPGLLLVLENYVHFIAKAMKEAAKNLQFDDIMQQLKLMLAETYEISQEMSQPFPETQTQIESLHQSASILFQEFEKSPHRSLILTAISAIQSFFPLFLHLSTYHQPITHPVTDDSPVQFSITDAMRTLQPLHSELHELASTLSTTDPTYVPHLQTVSSEINALFEEFRTSPQCFLLPKTISAIRAYSPLLKALVRKAKECDKSAINETAMIELEIAATEVVQLAGDLSEIDSSFNAKLNTLQKDLEVTFEEYHTSPQEGDLLAAVRGIRCHFPVIKELIRSAGLRTAMDMLRSVVEETHKFVLSLADDTEIAAKLPLLEANANRPFEEFNHSPKKLCFQTALKTLQAYHPLMVIYWWKRGMRALSELVSDFDLIISRFFPQHAESLFALRDKSSTLFATYKSEYTPVFFPQAVHVLFAYHRLLTEGCDEPFIPSPDMSHIPALPSEPSEQIMVLEASPADIKQAESIIESEKGDAVSNNILIQSLQKANVPTDKPLTYLNIFKFFEELMDKKFEVDTQDLAAFRKPRGMTEFLMEHLNRQFGIKSLAMKFLGQLLPGLNILFTEKIPYAVLFARLLQVFHPDPIPFPLAMFLTKIRPEFHKLIEKCAREREVREKRSIPARKSSSKSPITYGRAAYDLAASGGEAFTSDVITLMYDLFDNDPISGELALRLLRPEAISLVDYVLFKVCHKMTKMGMSPDGVFNVIDADGGGSIDQEEFVKGIASNLELWIAESDIIEVHTAIAVNGQMSRSAFLNRCNFDWFMAVAKSEDYITTKCEFLNVLIDVFNRKQRDDTAQLVALFVSRNLSLMPKATFCDVVRSLDPMCSTERIDMMWQSAGEQGGMDATTGISQLAFVKYIPAVEKAVEDRKMETVDIDLKEMYAKKGGVIAVRTNASVKTPVRKAGSKRSI